MTTSTIRYPRYHEDFQALASAGPGPSWLGDLRAAAWERFNELGLPTARRGNERWKYTNLRPLAAITFESPQATDSGSGLDAGTVRSLAPWDDAWTNLVFVDGKFTEALSTTAPGQDGNVCSDLASALSEDSGAIRDNLARLALFDDDAFAALNTAFTNDGALVQVPDNAVSASPVNLVFIATEGPQPQVTHPRTLVQVGRNARLTLVESYVNLAGGRNFTNAVLEMAVGEGSHVDHYRLLMDTPDGFHVGTSRVLQGQDSSVTSSSFTTGAAMARNDFLVTLDAPGAFCELRGLYATTGSQHIDNLINIDHAKPHTTSRLFYKGILSGRSRAVFGGTVTVRRDAQKSDSRQTDKNLVLSHEAEVDSKPSLLIYADDVQCGHGATAGHIDQDTLFYMQSRGLDRAAATRMLIQAFAAEIVDTVGVEQVHGFLESVFADAVPFENIAPYPARGRSGR